MTRAEARKLLDQAEIDRIAAERDLERNRRAFEGGAVAQIDVARAQDALKKAQLALAQARQGHRLQDRGAGLDLRNKRLLADRQRAVVAELQRQVDALTLRAPFDGQVGQVMVQQRQNVATNAPVLSVVDLTEFEVEITVPESFARDLAIGMPAQLRGAAGTFDAKVSAVSPEVVNNLLELAQTRAQLARHRAGQARRRRALDGFDLCDLVYADPGTEAALTLACQVARSDLPVLITGPNGVGKEKFAEVIHANSQVRQGPFVAVNCGALPGELIEAELFGAEAGAYTGATRAREGKFEAADGGTLFLDAIGTLPLAGQIKLLRVLETGRFQRLGSNRERTVKVRVLSATNADLRAMIAQGQFREDLFYRLNAVEVHVPPLAQRPDDILPLARRFLPPGRSFGDDAERALLAHAWPGNVRELRNTVQRAALLAREETIRAGDLGLPAARAAAPHGASRS